MPEYGRFYYEGRATSLNGDKGAAWSSEEFVKIARSQQALEAQLLQLANRVLVCDTDALATHVFHKHYLGCAQPPPPIPFQTLPLLNAEGDRNFKQSSYQKILSVVGTYPSRVALPELF